MRDWEASQAARYETDTRILKSRYHSEDILCHSFEESHHRVSTIS